MKKEGEPGFKEKGSSNKKIKEIPNIMEKQVQKPQESFIQG